MPDTVIMPGVHRKPGEPVVIQDATSTGQMAGVDSSGNLKVIPAANDGVDIGNVDVASIAAGDNNIGNVDVASVAAGETHLGEVGGKTTVVTLSVTRPNDTSAYAARDCWANATSSAAVATLSGCARVNAGSGVINSLVVIDDQVSATQPSLELWIFDTVVTAQNDNAAIPTTDAEALTCVGIIDISSWKAGLPSGNSVANIKNINIPFVCGAASTSLWFMIVVTAAYTPVAQEKLSFRLGIYQD